MIYQKGKLPQYIPSNPAQPHIRGADHLLCVFKIQTISLMIIVVSALLGMLGCEDSLFVLGESKIGIRATPKGSGPQVIYDFLTQPLPEIPLPNDDATRYDATSPTKRRINVSFNATTQLEARARESFNMLDGFGTYAPISVSFDQPLDVIDLWERHNLHDPKQDKFRDDFRDDAVYIFNIDPSCDRYQEEVAIDMGRGRFPITMYKHIMKIDNDQSPKDMFFKFSNLFYFSIFDPHAPVNNLIFEEWDEDQNQNGELEPDEDIDSDGRLDVANLLHPNACHMFEIGTIEKNRCVADELMTFYERESNTLILRPVWPLESRCQYAVVLTNRLTGEDGEPVHSPFKGVNPQGQTEALEQVKPLLPRYNLGIDDVAFAWTFTTGTTTQDLEALRAGLYGVGVFKSLSEEFSTTQLHLWTRGELDSRGELPEEVKGDTHLSGSCVSMGLAKYWVLAGEWDANLCSIEADNAGMDMVFGGTFRAPDLLLDKDEDPPPTVRYPQTADELWEVEAHTGRLRYGSTEVTFWCSLPDERDTSCSDGNPEGTPFCKPFPTILYAHGYGGSRAEVIVGHIGRTNSMGYAMCALDAYGHGLNVLLEENDLARQAAFPFSVLKQYGVPDYKELLLRGRDRDLNNDGIPDSGADMWTSDIFHTRDMVRQIVLEHMQFIRILRSFNGETVGENGVLLGDVDQDGVVDLAGPSAPISMWGISLGGIISGVLAGAEPSLDAVSPNAGGAGLVDIASRSSQAGVPEAVMLPILGPFIVGCLPTDEHQTPLTQGEGKSCFSSSGRSENTETSTLKAGELELAFLLNDNASQKKLPFALLKDVKVGDWIELENLKNGEVKRHKVSDRGTLMISVPSDALSATERRGVLGLSDDDRGGVESKDNLLLGDRLILRHFSAQTGRRAYRNTRERLNSSPVAVIEEFQWPVEFQGTIYPKSSPLVSLQEGLGIDRNTPRFRRFMGLAQSALGPGDPAIWSAHIALEPLDFQYDPHAQWGNTHVLQMPTVGDRQVPVNTGIAAARVSGLFGSWLRDEERFPDPRYGWRELFQPTSRYSDESASKKETSIDQLLIDRYVVEGDAKLKRYRKPSRDPQINYEISEDEALHPYTLFDVDNISDGQARFSCGDEDWSAKNGEFLCSDEWRAREQVFPIPYDPLGLRVQLERGEGRYDVFRVPLIRPTGQHGIYNPQPFRYFDTDAFMVNFTTRFLGSRGQRVDHLTGCDCSASEIPSFRLNDDIVYPVKRLDSCIETDLNLCDSMCAQQWGIQTRSSVVCTTNLY